MIIDIDKMVELHKQGMNDSEIAQIFGVTRSAVGYQRRKLNLPANWERRKSLTEEEKNDLCRLHSTGMSIKLIAEELGFGISLVRNFFIKEGFDTSMKRAHLYRRQRRIELYDNKIFLVYENLKQYGPKEESDLVELFSLNKPNLRELKNVVDIFRLDVLIKIDRHKRVFIKPTYVIRGDERIVDYITDRCNFTIDNKFEASKMRYILAEYIGAEHTRQVIEKLGYKYNSDASMTGSGVHGGKFAPLEMNDTQRHITDMQQVIIADRKGQIFEDTDLVRRVK